MHRREFLGMASVGVAVLLRHPLAYAASDGITVGLTGTIFPGLSNAALATAAKPFRALLEDATGVNGTVVQGGTPKELAARLSADEVQLGVFQGIEYAYARQTNEKLQPLVQCVNQSATLTACLVVRSAFGGQSIADLKGKTLALAVDAREHCKVFARHSCGSALNDYFKSQLATVDADEALDEVHDGNVTAALVDGQAWAAYTKTKAGCARNLRVLATSEPFPTSVVVCQQGRFSDTQLARFREGLVAAKNSPRGKKLLEFLRMTGFEVAGADYEKLVAAIVKTYPQ